MPRRPQCKDQACDVEIEEGRKYCAAHEWLIQKWLRDARRKLQMAKKGKINE